MIDMSQELFIVIMAKTEKEFDMTTTRHAHVKKQNTPGGPSVYPHVAKTQRPTEEPARESGFTSFRRRYTSATLALSLRGRATP